MGETGKRPRSYRDDTDSKHQRRRADFDRDIDGKSNDELIVYRILCPDGLIGSVIGKNGKVIKSIRQDSRAKVKVVDRIPGAKDRVITVFCYVRDKEDIEVDDEFDGEKPICPAQDALLKVHVAIANAATSLRDSERRKRDTDREECRLLVPFSQSASIIGKSGATIKRLRNKTRTNVKVTAKDAGDPAHSCALEFDNFVLISGEPEAVKKALFVISAIMYKFSAKETIPLDTSAPEAPPRIIFPSDAPLYSSTGLYSSIDSVNPGRSVPSILGSSHASGLPGYGDTRTTWPVYSSAVPVLSGYGRALRAEELRIKLLCPANKIGRVIGKGGSAIRIIRQDSGAQVEVVDPKTNHDECLVNVISKEVVRVTVHGLMNISSDDFKSMAVEAVLLLQGKIDDEDDETVVIRLLIPSKVIGCIIGKSGSIINEIRKRTKADIRISKGQRPKFADEDDELVEINGRVDNVRDALVQIVLRLREDVLKDRDEARKSSASAEALYSGGAALPIARVLRTVPSGAGLNYEQRADTGSGMGLLSSSPYGYDPLSMGENDYGSLLSHSSALYARLPQPSALEMVVPAHAGGKVIGKGGTNIDNIRKISGAAIDISDSRSSRGDRVALISGTSEQKRSAENLIQAFILST